MTTLVEPYYLSEKRALCFRYHQGQHRAMESRARFILVLAGLQSGKTLVGPWWLLREMIRRGAGDYLVASPTFRLLNLKCLPEYKALFRDRLQLGTFRDSPAPEFRLSTRGEEILFGAPQAEPTRIIFGHAQDPDSLESATAKAAHLDEAGQKKFKRSSHEAVLGRLSIHQGRILYTTTPYTLGWLKTEVYDRARAGDIDYEVIQFESTMNPVFPQAEFDSMKKKLPAWKFNMRYRGQFEKPAGVIYGCFDGNNIQPRFPIPISWPRYLGLDFGSVNTAAVFLAREPGNRRTCNYYLYRTYHAGGRTAEGHTEKLIDKDEPRPTAVGGSHSESQWRREFAHAGLVVREPPVREVEVGIDRVYGLIKQNRLIVFKDLLDIISDLHSYSRVLDDNDEPTEKIEDKETWHRLDALRYIGAHIAGDPVTITMQTIDF